MPPWRRALHPDTRRRLTSWCAELLPGVPVHIVEWAGADPRQPIHAVVLSFPSTDRSRVVFYEKSEDVTRSHLVEALCVPATTIARSPSLARAEA